MALPSSSCLLVTVVQAVPSRSSKENIAQITGFQGQIAVVAFMKQSVVVGLYMKTKFNVFSYKQYLKVAVLYSF
jgi:hypothetical protein